MITERYIVNFYSCLLYTSIPYRGTYVTLLSLDNIKQMIYMRVAVETMVLRDFMQNRTPMVMEDRCV